MTDRRPDAIPAAYAYYVSILNSRFMSLKTISAMIAAGSKKIKQILIASPNENFCPPCGGCRQKIAEFADAQTEVHLATNQGEIKTVKFTELLPLAFGFDKE